MRLWSLRLILKWNFSFRLAILWKHLTYCIFNMKPTSLFKLSGLFIMLGVLVFFYVDKNPLNPTKNAISLDLDLIVKLLATVILIIGIIMYNMSSLVKDLKKAIRIAFTAHLAIVGLGVCLFFTGFLQKLAGAPLFLSFSVRVSLHFIIIGLYINALKKL